MDASEYQRRTRATAIYADNIPATSALAYVALGLNGEAGEVAEHVKKAIRDDGGQVSEARRQLLVGELGDVCWYLASCCEELGLDLGEVMEANLAKLASRKERGVLGGAGSTR